MEMNVPDRHEAEKYVRAYLDQTTLFVLAGREMSVEKSWDLGFHVRAIHAFGQAGIDRSHVIGKVSGAVEVVVVAAAVQAFKSEVGSKEIEVEVGIRRDVLHDASNLEQESAVHQDCFP